MAAQPILTTHDLRQSFGYVEAVRTVNLKVCLGEAFGLLGPNGAGKTTIISATRWRWPGWHLSLFAGVN